MTFNYFEKSECRLCGMTAAQIAVKNSFSVFRCDFCSFIFTELKSSEFDPLFEYHNYGANKTYLSKKEKKLKRSEKRIKRCKKLVQKYRFLDIGCSVGIACEAARLSGFDVVGIDVDAAAIQIGRKEFPQCMFFNELATEYAKRGEKFDVIYCSEVIEHVPDPLALLQSIKDLLASNGVVWMSTPDSGHWRTPRNLVKWKELAPPDHIGLFNRKSLDFALAKVGLKVIKQEMNLKWGLKVIIAHQRS